MFVSTAHHSRTLDENKNLACVCYNYKQVNGQQTYMNEEPCSDIFIWSMVVLHGGAHVHLDCLLTMNFNGALRKSNESITLFFSKTWCGHGHFSHCSASEVQRHQSGAYSTRPNCIGPCRMFLNIVWLGKCRHKSTHQTHHRLCFGSLKAFFRSTHSQTRPLESGNVYDSRCNGLLQELKR